MSHPVKQCRPWISGIPQTAVPAKQRKSSHGPTSPRDVGNVRRHATRLPTAQRPKVRCTKVGQEPLPWPVRPLLADEVAEVTDPTEFCGAVIRGAVEVLAGSRSAHQLRAWVTPQVFGQLKLRAELEREKPPSQAIAQQGAARVRKVVLHRVGDQAEATVLVDTADRVRAAAARLALHRGLWRVCVLEIA